MAYINRKISLTDIKIFNNIMRFDIILCLSVLHHVPGNVSEWINELNKMCNYLVIEFAGEDSKRTNLKDGYFLPYGYTEIGSAKSHLADYDRQIVVYKNVI